MTQTSDQPEIITTGKYAGEGHTALRHGRASLTGQIYHVSTTTICRSRLFADFRMGCVAARCFESRTTLVDAQMLAWVLMPDHVHWLIQLGEKTTLDTLVSRLKATSARNVNQISHRTGAVWARAYHDHALRSDEDLASVARYIVANPLRAGLVKSVAHYPFWNAIFL
ncbi:MAG: transposase [Glaciimonas sp.]|nr:transposase [Glaciimonas sp.]